MKLKIFSGVLMMVFYMCSNAQITIQLVVNPAPPAKLSEWAARSNTVTLIATNASAGPRQVVMRSEIKTINGDVVATRIPVAGIVYTLPPGNTVFSARDVVPLNQMSFAGSYKSGLLRTGKLPQGMYTLTVQLDSSSGIPLTAPVTRDFTMTGVQLPVLFAPYDNQPLPAVTAQTAITFRWTNVIKSTAGVPSYNLQVFEVLPHQKTVQALRANQPVLNVIIKGNTQYIWRPQLLFMDSLEHKFIWTIRTTDELGNLYSTTDTNPEGRSEPRVFVIKNSARPREN
ncbi:MAG TPA: hypothetical protein PLZ45_06910 [Ferruginibacter sp.]|nr:hypothetical protein [Chitinophagaceae bacterium]HRI24389.1 hypothetical protein [Ferruginibacter sp.]